MQDMKEIYNKYCKIVYKYVFCLTANEDITEEIVQETFLIAVKNINNFRGECKVSTWLCQISKYIWYKRLKKEKIKKDVSLDEIQDELFTEETIEDSFLRKEEKIKLFKKIQNLDENTRNVMYLRIFGNFEYDEIAEIMNRTSNWARVIFFRGKQKLKEEFDK